MTLPPSQNDVGPLAVIEAGGFGSTWTYWYAARLQAFASVTVTECVPVVLATMERVVAPFDQSQLVPSLAVRVTLPPSQNLVGPDAVMLTVGSGFTVTFTAADGGLLHPSALIAMTV